MPLVAVPDVTRADGNDDPKNLQILPKSTKRADIKKIMKTQAHALGVDCDYCHDIPDMASDKKETKLAARRMMKMTEELNAKWFADKKTRSRA